MKNHSTSKFITVLIIAALGFLCLPKEANAGGYYEERFSHYDYCGRPVYVPIVIERRYYCPPPVVYRYHRPIIVHPPYWRSYDYCGPRSPRVGFSFSFYR